MRFLLVAAALVFVCSACDSNEDAPDVSAIKVTLSTQRFEKDFFTMDSSRFAEGLEKLMVKYPGFGENFVATILNTDPKWSTDTALTYIKTFSAVYRVVYDSTQKVFADFIPYEKQIKKSLQYLKYYFPQYAAPKKIITYIGPMDGYGDILDVDAFIIGLHQHLGSNYSMYKSALVRETYPDYISRRFTPDYIVINCMKNVILDMYPEKFEDQSLVVQMVEKGKRLYLLQKLVPYAKNFQLVGFTEKQFAESIEREAAIWDLFVQNSLLQSQENGVIKDYIGEAPKTSALGEAAPGNIGSFCGWQIVQKFMNKFPETTPQQLMTTDAEVLFSKAKYKP